MFEDDIGEGEVFFTIMGLGKIVRFEEGEIFRRIMT